MKHPLSQLILTQFREFFREPGIIFWAMLFPILMAWVLGIAFTKKGELVKRVAYIESTDQRNEAFREFIGFSANPPSRGSGGRGLNLNSNDFIRVIENDKLGNMTFRFIKAEWEEAELMLKRGKVSLIIEEMQPEIIFHFDPNNGDAQLVYLQLNAAINNEQLLSGSSQIETLTGKGSRYIDFLIPGLIAMGIMNSCMWGISFALIDMRRKNLLRRMVATPMKKSHFLISHFVARIAMATLEAGIVFVFAYFYFDVTVQGNILALIAVFLAGIIAFSGLAILMSSRTAQSRVGQGLINLVVLPMTILSGIFFSYHNFPDWAIPFIQALPLTLLADGMRAIFIEGVGLQESIMAIVILTGVGIVLFLAGLRIYKWY